MRKSLLIFIAASSLLTVVFLFNASATGRTIFALLTAIGALVLVSYHFVSRRNENPPFQFVDQSQPPNKPQLPIDTLFDATISSMREGMLVVDRDMRVVASNPVAYRLFGSAPRSVTNQRLTELTRNPAVYQAFLDGLQGIERSSVKVDMVGVERSVFELRVTPLALGNGNGPSGALGVFIDVTRTERLELVRQEFLSNVSHELRTPLTSVLAFVETLENGALEDPESSRRFLAIIRKNASRMHELIDELLELTAIEGGNVRLRATNVELRPLVDESISSLAAKAEAREISLVNNVPAGIEVYADGRRLERMLTNLIDNGIKFNGPKGQVTIRHETGARDKIIVEDDGDGIPMHHLERLFERFYRVDRARSSDMGGTGLGLAIVKHLALLHGGEVTVTSELEKGTSFTIHLPHAPESN
ncbi:MAG TPA: ATP-binding protein [Pyrinomonadaceae bacterium]|nr:ATP-binding protein [Pyrinomonadaceae bacterium]